ncbi:MAG TPA: VOC family protein [Alphaproteobacteria bacterium]|jgi:catechol-2,3-dioxygenase|nr:VOC family protein [Alphaproteobacteria bacterium]
MARMNSISHSVINVDDLAECEHFYVDILGGEKRSACCFDTEDTMRGRSVHETYILQDYVFFVALAERPLPKPPENQHRGLNGFRTAFCVPQKTFDETLAAFKKHNIGFEGPVEHPRNGPFGQSIYFKDPSGNFMEFLTRRDEGTPAFAKPNFLGIG